MQNLRKLSSVLALFGGDRPELTGSEIAALLGRPKSTVYRTLNAIVDVGFLDRDGATGRYRLGIRLASLGEVARQSTSLQRLAHRALRQVTDATNEMSTIMVLSGNQGINIEVVESRQALMLPGLVGTPQPLHASAAGKVLLSDLADDRVVELLGWPLHRYTATTITDRARLLAELRAVRRRGYATSIGEHSSDVVGVGAPVRDHRGAIVAAMTCGCPDSRGTAAQLERMIRTVVAEAGSLSRALGYRGPTAALPASLNPRRSPRRARARV
jgi:DNA-binding IclR family transcriptional regulator